MASIDEQKDGFLKQLLQRARELHKVGFDCGHAHGVAWLEERIRQWPTTWDNDLQILIYGNFEPPKTEIYTESLGITVHSDKLENTVIHSARCVLKATVKIREKSVEALIEASRRVNVFLGAWALVTWGNGACRCWSYVT